jgi:hypothetical protein
MTRVEYNRLRRTGGNPEHWRAEWARQDGLCPICATALAGYHLDDDAPVQDHADKQIDGKWKPFPRGVLCRRCNLGIGKFYHLPILLRAAADYIEEWEERERLKEVAE